MEEKRRLSKSDKKKIRELRKEIKTGSSKAKLELAKIYYDIPPGKHDKILLKMLYELANEKNTDAMLYLARGWGTRGFLTQNMSLIKQHNFLVQYEGDDHDSLCFDHYKFHWYFFLFKEIKSIFFKKNKEDNGIQNFNRSIKWYLKALKEGALLTKEDLDLALAYSVPRHDTFFFSKFDWEFVSLYELAENKNVYAQVIYYNLYKQGREYYHLFALATPNKFDHIPNTKKYYEILGLNRNYCDASPNDFIELRFIHDAIENDTEDIGAILKYVDFLSHGFWVGDGSPKEWFLFINNEITYIFKLIRLLGYSFSKKYIYELLYRLNLCYRNLSSMLEDVVITNEDFKKILQNIDEYYDEYIDCVSQLDTSFDSNLLYYYKRLLQLQNNADVSPELKYECHLKELLLSTLSYKDQQGNYNTDLLKGINQKYKELMANPDYIEKCTYTYMEKENIYLDDIGLPYMIAIDIKRFAYSSEIPNSSLLQVSNHLFEKNISFFTKIVNSKDSEISILEEISRSVKGKAHYYLAQIYKYGYGVKADFELADTHILEYGRLSGKNICNERGLTCSWFNKYDEAITHYQKALTEIDIDTELKAIIEYNIGYTYIEKNIKNENAENIEIALKWFKRSKEDECKEADEAIMMIANLTSDKIRSLESANNQILTQNMEKERLQEENDRLKTEVLKKLNEINTTTHRTEEKVDKVYEVLVESDKIIAASLKALSTEIKSMQGDLEDIDAKIDERFDELSKTEANKLLHNTCEDRISKAKRNIEKNVNPIYDQLTEATKDGLIAAELTYDALQGMETTFSGVIVHLCASLEQQVKYVFWYTYKNYCRNIYGEKKEDLHKWPSKLTYPKNQKEPDNLSESGQFMLGDLNMYCHPDKITRSPHNSKENKKKNLSIFRSFLKAILQDECYNKNIKIPEKALSALVNRVESIREFRNESAHGNTMSSEDAKKCYGMILGKNGQESAFNLIYDIVDAQKVMAINSGQIEKDNV